MARTTKTKGTRKRSAPVRRESGEGLGGLSFDPRIRTDKLRGWLDRHPGELPPGLTREQVAEIFGE